MRRLGAVWGAWLAKRRWARKVSEPRKRSPPALAAGGESGQRCLGMRSSRSARHVERERDGEREGEREERERERGRDKKMSR